MAQDTLLMIGKKIMGDAGRDAIHIAVAPAIAGERLRSGMRVVLESFNGVTVASFASTLLKATPIGIVDPFLTAWVEKGEKFFIFLMPGSITSLRHEWTHPAFDKPMEEACTGSPTT